MYGEKRTTSRVEEVFLGRSGQPLRYEPTEKIGVIVVEHFPALGKLAALRFLEWVQGNPGGVVSLPTGKTPEYFIKWVTHYLRTWETPETRRDLEENGILASTRPDMRSLRFVQIDEFYPIDPAQHNSFYYYVNRFYLGGFGLDPQQAMLIDCTRIGLPSGRTLEDVWGDGGVDLSLRYRPPRTNQEALQKAVLESVDQWCSEYEDKIRALGGIGFFLGGIGPDGHIAFNVTGTDHHSTTRLTPTNYETQAAAAADLGGIEVARKRLAITIGLATITFNPDCTAIIIAAGEAKARVVRDAVQEDRHIRYPATALHRLPNARFYVTQGAARLLVERQHRALAALQTVPDETVIRVLVDISLRLRKRIVELTEADLRQDRFGAEILGKMGAPVSAIAATVERTLLARLEAGSQVRSRTTFLHTAPHHDDIELGYLPYAVRHIRDSSNRHVFAYLTSGFTAVTNRYALSLLEKLEGFLRRGSFASLLREGYFNPSNLQGRNRDVWQYLDGVAAGDPSVKDEGEARRLLRNLIAVFEEEDIDNLRHRITELINYFRTQYPGRRDLLYVQQLKGMIREWEAECLWGYLGLDTSCIRHVRLGFYKGDIFTEDPRVDRDVPPVLQLLRETRPDIVTVALDPEGSGPDTHYKVMQTVAEALRTYERESGGAAIEILGYRNVWFRFHAAEANLYVPVSLNMFAVLQNAFLNAFVSQKDASFPSYECDGPFSTLAQQIHVEQYQTLKTCLGRQFFNEHPRPLIRGTRGCVFLRRMSPREFYSYARELKKTTEQD